MSGSLNRPKANAAACFSALLSLACAAAVLPMQARGDETASQVASVFRALTPSVVVVDCVIDVRTARATRRFPVKTVGIIVGESGRVMITATIFARAPTGMPSDFRVTLSTGEQFSATSLGRDEDVNLAFLQIVPGTTRRFSCVKFARKELAIGERILAVGLLPKRYDHRPQFGLGRVNAVIDKVIRFYTADQLLADYLGGPVATLDGTVVGIVSVDIVTSQSLGDDLGPRMKAVILPTAAFAKLIETPPGKVAKKGWLGIEMQALDRDVARALGVGNTTGIIVSRVFRGLEFPAEQAGLQREDIITHFDARRVPVAHRGEEYMFRRLVRDAGPRPQVPLRVLRSGQRLDLVIDLAQTPKSHRDARRYRDEEFGVVVSEITLDMALALDLFSLGVDIEGALVNTVDPAGWVGLGGLRANDIVLAIDRQPVKTVDDFQRLLSEVRKQKKRELVLFVRRRGETAFVRVEPAWK